MPDQYPRLLPATLQHSQRVNELFNSDSGSRGWRAVYEKKDVYSVIHQERQSASLALIDKLRLAPGSDVLDLGCGPGFMTLALAQRQFNVRALDAAPKMVSLTQDLISRTPFTDRVNVSSGLCEALPFANGSFDLVVALGVLPWVAAAEPVLEEIVRVLRPGAYLVANVDNPWRLNLLLDVLQQSRMAAGRALRALGWRKTEPLSHFHSPKQFHACLARAGLNRVEAKMLGFGPFTLAQRRLFSDPAGVKLHHSLQALADRGVPVLRATGAQYLVLAQRGDPPGSGDRDRHG